MDKNIDYRNSSISQKNKIRFNAAMEFAKIAQTGITTRRLFDYFGTIEPYASMSEKNRMFHAGQAFTDLKHSGYFTKPIKYKNNSDLQKCQHISLKSARAKTTTSMSSFSYKKIVGQTIIGQKTYWLVDPK